MNPGGEGSTSNTDHLFARARGMQGYGRGAGVGRTLGDGLGLGDGVGLGVVVGVAVAVAVAVGVVVAVGVGVELGDTVGVAVAVGVGVGVASDWKGAWISTATGAPVLKKAMFAVLVAGAAGESNRKLDSVPHRIALAFWFCAKVSQFHTAEFGKGGGPFKVKVQGVLL